MAQPITLQADIEAIRRFTRFYTRRFGVLKKGLLDTDYSLPEARVLFELAHRGETTAKALADYLGMDAGYLSRLLARLEKHGLVRRETDARDARRRRLRLAPAGERAFAVLNARSKRQVEAMLERLDPAQRARLVDALGTVETLLEAGPEPAKPFILRAPQPGDLGWVIHRHGVLYSEEYGWDETFEALVARILGEFVAKRDPGRERGWIAEAGGEIVGSVFAARATDEVAQLRLLYVEPKYRGHGLGRTLVGECVRFAQEAGYRRMTLWTNSVLDAARHLYANAGFEIVKTEQHQSFGKSLTGEYWERELEN